MKSMCQFAEYALVCGVCVGMLSMRLEAEYALVCWVCYSMPSMYASIQK